MQDLDTSKAFNMESRAAHGAQDRDITYAGSKIKGNRVYHYYVDSMGEVWYENTIIMPDGTEKTEYEAIFGKRKRG